MKQRKFNEMNISKPILRALNDMGFDAATEVQAKSIEPMKLGKDLMVQSPTGTGKTAAFGIPMLENIDQGSNKVQALVLCPTRELATQISKVLHDLTKYMSGVRVQALYGGEQINRQIQRLKKKPQIVVATPGRLMDHMKRRTVRLDDLKIAVLDEADRMLDMGFRNDIKKILDSVPEERQTVMFSATLSNEIKQIAKTYQRDVMSIQVKQKQSTVESVTQYYTDVQRNQKAPTLVKLLRDNEYDLSLVFVGRKYRADELARTLNANKFKAAALHGDMKQSKRDNVMKQYRNGHLDVLVATDVAARGIDVNNIDAVINYDIPEDSESYVHRIGRTGRAKQEGVSYTFISGDENSKLKSIMRQTKTDIPYLTLHSTDKFVKKPRKKHNQNRQHHKR